MGLGIPEAAGVGRNLVRQHDGAVAGLAELQLEVDQLDARLLQEAAQELVDFQGIAGNQLDLLLGGPAHGGDVVFVDHGVAQVVVLVAVLNDGLFQLGALGHAQALAQAAGGDIAHNDLQGYDVNLLHQGLPVGDFLDVVGGDAVLFQHLHEEIGHPVVNHALAGDGALLQAVEGGGVVLVIHQHHIGIVRCENLLGLALVNLLQLLHDKFLLHPIRSFRCP